MLPLKRFSLRLGVLATRKRVYVFSESHLLQRLLFRQLILDIRGYRMSVRSRGIHVISATPEMPISILVFQVRMPIKYHQRTFPFQIPHKLRYT